MRKKFEKVRLVPLTFLFKNFYLNLFFSFKQFFLALEEKEEEEERERGKKMAEKKIYKNEQFIFKKRILI